MTKVMHFHFGKDGGAERFFVHLLNALAERGVEQHIVIRPDRSWKSLIDPSVRITESHFRTFSLDRVRLPLRMRSEVLSWKPDAILGWMPKGAKLVPAVTDPIRLVRLGDYPTALKKFRNIDVVVGNTPGIVEHVREMGWQRGTAVVSNFTDLEQVDPIDRTSLQQSVVRPVISAMGRFVPRKGFDTLIRAVARHDHAELWLIGNGEQEQNLKALAADLNVANRVRFLGWQADPRPFIAASDVFVMPSSHEPLGNVILEAWAQGRPVVSTRSEGPLWFMRDGENGLLVDIGDAEAMALAIGRLLANPGLAAQLTDGGRETLEGQFSKKAITDAYLELFQTPPDRFR